MFYTYKLCKEWCTSVNISKTKIITFNKPGRLIKCNFCLNNKTLECVKHDKYIHCRNLFLLLMF